MLSGPSARAQAEADTLPGQNRFIRQMASSLCTRIQEASQKEPLDKLTPQQADDLFRRLMLTSMSEHAEGFSALMTEGKRRKMSNNKLGRDLGVAAIKQLSADCPGSMALLIRTSSAQKELGSQSQSVNEVSADEKVVLQPIADSICAQMAVEDRRRPLKQRTPAERMDMLTTLMQTAIVKNMPGLLSIYSMEQINNKDSRRAFGVKLASLMVTQCPSYIILLGEDATKKRR
ncbi:hypothetical protein GCM10027345_12200 [Hymenobacter daeguensis]